MNSRLYHQLKLLSLGAVFALSTAQCTGFNDDDNDDAKVALAAVLALANSSTSSAAFTITNNSGATRTYNFHLSGSNCTNAVAATTGAVANGAVGSASVQANRTGYDITNGATCSAVEKGKTTGVFRCTDSGGAIACE